MITIRLPKNKWGKAWRLMIEAGPVRLVADDPLYEVLPAHLELLDGHGFRYEVVKPCGCRSSSTSSAAEGASDVRLVQEEA
jgi:hypothetical protein